EVAAFHDVLLAADADVHPYAAEAALDALDLGAFADADPFLGELLDDEPGELWILVAERLLRLQHDDARAEPAVGLRQLQPHRAAAEHDQAMQALLVAEDRLAGEVGHVDEAGDRRNERRRAGGDDEAAGLDAVLAGHDGTPANEARRRLDDAH